MAHFAELDNNNIVQKVVVIDNNILVKPNGEENEDYGVIFCKQHFGFNSKWIQTSYNKSFRKNYASTGFTYDSNRDAFIPPKPYPSWILNEDTCQWESPIPYPSDDNEYTWNEDTQNWEFTT